jgi:ABC-2 type transport system permease protein
MRKTWLIIKREYLTRVRKRTFIISTLLFPLFYVGLIFGTSYVAEKSRQSLKVAIIDSSGYFTDSLLTKYNKDDKSSTLVLANGQAAKVIADHKEAGYDAYIVIPKFDWKSGINSLQMKAAKSYGSGQEMVVRM